MRALLRRAAVVVGLSLLLTLPSLATIVARMDVPGLVRSSGLIVHGRVVRHWSEWDSSHRFIWTHYTLAVSDSMKGAPGSTITVSEPGGTVGQDRMQVAGAPAYTDQEEVVVFLSRTPLGYWRSTGWAQGKYRVTRGTDGVSRIRTSLEGISLADSPARGRRPALDTASPLLKLNGMPLVQFKRLVRSHLAGPEVVR